MPFARTGQTRLPATLFGILIVCCASVSSKEVEFTPLMPSARYLHAMAYDEARERVVLFGGRKDFTFLGDLWEWDGERWNYIKEGKLPNRYGHQLYYDPTRQRIRMLGGVFAYRGPAESYNDVREWNGHDWVTVSATIPVEGLLAYDSNRNALINFLGSNYQTNINETWEWNNSAWNLVHQMFPGMDMQSNMVYDSSRRVTVLYGLSSRSDPETWEWDGTKWQLRNIVSPPGRVQHGIAYDENRKKVVIFGGYGDISDTWEYDGNRWEQVSQTGPPGNRYVRMTYDKARKNTVLFGNLVTNGHYVTGETWTWDGEKWTLAAAQPEERADSTSVYDEKNRRFVIFGGEVRQEVTNDTWLWDGDRFQKWQPDNANVPPPRHAHAMTYDTNTQTALLFGGGVGSGNNMGRDNWGDTWVWSGDSWTQLFPTTSPGSRREHGMTFDKARNRVVLFGGNLGDYSVVDVVGPPYQWHDYGALNDTWEFDGSQWYPMSNDGPSPRLRPLLAYDENRRVTVLYGGQNGSTSFQDTWEWDGTEWRFVTDSSPQGFTTSMHYDATRSTVVLYTLYIKDDYASRVGQVWEYDGDGWTFLGNSAPLTDNYTTMFYEPFKQKMYLFGIFPESQIWEMDLTHAGQQSAVDYNFGDYH